MLNCVPVSKDKPSHGITKLPHVSTEAVFLQWFSGFTDAEGSFKFINHLTKAY